MKKVKKAYSKNTTSHSIIHYNKQGVTKSTVQYPGTVLYFIYFTTLALLYGYHTNTVQYSIYSTVLVYSTIVLL